MGFFDIAPFVRALGQHLRIRHRRGRRPIRSESTTRKPEIDRSSRTPCSFLERTTKQEHSARDTTRREAA